jgi:hypothetical protein
MLYHLMVNINLLIITSSYFKLDSSQHDNLPVIHRQRNPFSSNRNNNLDNLFQENPNNYSIPLNSSDATLFYVTSSIFDDDSNSSTSSDQPSLSVNDFSMSFFFFQ